MEKNMQQIAGMCICAAMGMLLLFPPAAPAQTPQEKGRAIAEEADRRTRGYGDSTARLRMVLRNRQGQTSDRDLRIRLLEAAGDTKSLCIFDSPADVKQTILLT